MTFLASAVAALRYQQRQLHAAREFERGLKATVRNVSVDPDPDPTPATDTRYDSGMTNPTSDSSAPTLATVTPTNTGYRFTDFEVGEDLYLVHLAGPRRPDRSALMPVRVTRIERDVTEWAFPNWLYGDKIWVTRAPLIAGAATYTYVVTSTQGPLWRFEDARTAVFRARVRADLEPAAKDDVYAWLDRFTPTQVYQAGTALGLDLERAWAEYSRSGPVQWVDVAALLAASADLSTKQPTSG